MRAVQSLQHAACDLQRSLQRCAGAQVLTHACGALRSLAVDAANCEDILLAGKQTKQPSYKQASPNGTSGLANPCVTAARVAKTARRPVTTLARCGRSERDFDAARWRGWTLYCSVCIGRRWLSSTVHTGCVARLLLHAARCMLRVARCCMLRVAGGVERLAPLLGSPHPTVVEQVAVPKCMHACALLFACACASISKSARSLRAVHFCVARLCR
jgi:hypothetical protein